MDQAARNGVGFINFAFPGIPSVRCVFTTRRGGAGSGPFQGGNYSLDVGDDPKAVLANRRSLQTALGFSSWTEMRQVHGDAIHVDPLPSRMDGAGTLEGDGSATAAPGQALIVKTADCQPLMLAHASGGWVMALHVGWRGNRANLPGLGVARFCAAYGLDPADVKAVRGPSLGPAHSEFVNFDQEFGPDFAAWRDAATRTADLWRMTRDQLLYAGLRPENVFGLDLCTRSLESDFFSYRRDRTAGRQLGLIWIERVELAAGKRTSAA